MEKCGELVLVQLQLHGCFSRFLNCSNGTKSRKALKIYLLHWEWRRIDKCHSGSKEFHLILSFPEIVHRNEAYESFDLKKSTYLAFKPFQSCLFFITLKTSGNLWFSDVFRGGSKTNINLSRSDNVDLRFNDIRIT